MITNHRLHASLLLVVLTLLGGCDALGVAVYKLHGPPKVPAKFVPNPQAPVLILVENYQHQSSTAAHADILVQMLAGAFANKKIAPVIPPDQLVALRDARGERFKTMSVSAIGRELGAAQVLYVQLQRSDVTPLAGAVGSGDALGGQADATVKMIDVASGNTLWPTDVSAEAGYPVAASTKMGASSKGGSMNDVRRQMYVQLSDQIAKLFYKWQPDEMEPEGFEELQPP